MHVIRERRFLRVKLDMVTRCQLRCIMCHFAHPDFQESPVTMGGELLEKVAAELLTREVLDGEQVRRIVAGLALDEPKSPAGPVSPAPHEDESGRRQKERAHLVPPLTDPLPQE